MNMLIFTTALFASLLSLALASAAFTISPNGIGCPVILCASGTTCIETKDGPKCVPSRGFPPPKPTSCAAILCLEGTTCVEGPDGAQCVPVTSAPPTDLQPPDVCICPLFFDPVCCRFKNGDVKTVGNSCECTGCNSGNTIIASGQCEPTSCALVDCMKGFECVEEDGSAKCVPIDSCVCPKIFDPVCCRSASGIETKSNACFCTCEPSGRVLFNRECPGRHW